MYQKLPLLIHFIFHPSSGSQYKKLAKKFHSVGIPTVNLPEDGSFHPPVGYALEEAEKNVVIAFVDDDMVLESQNLPADRKCWSSFVLELWKKCQKTDDRFLPVQISDTSWPLDERLSETNFLRAYLQENGEKREQWLFRALMVEISRFLLGREPSSHDKMGERLPLKVFLSHAKQDINSEMGVFHALIQHLNTTQSIKSWVDSCDIEGGSAFGEEIEKGVEESALIVIVTDNYSSRTWCRREILLAKKHQRPFIIISAIEDFEARSFPYAGNAPVMRWAEGAGTKAIDLLLTEILRYLYANLLLGSQKKPTDIVLSVAPELATLHQIGIKQDLQVLYPDPPLGDEEIELLSSTGVKLETPIQRIAENRDLKEKTILLSISESEDPERQGLTQSHLDSSYLEISRYLLAKGASLRYGGQLQYESSYTIALFDMVQSYNQLSGLDPAERITCDIGWPIPFETADSKKTRAKYQRVASYLRSPRPSGLETIEPEVLTAEPIKFIPDSTPERRYAWGKGMTAMRNNQANSDAIARIVLGGKYGSDNKWYRSRIPGVIEEVLLSLKENQPVYLIGAFGGAAKLVIDLLQGISREEFTWDYQKQAPNAEEMRKIYEKRDKEWLGYKEMTTYFKEFGIEGLSRLNGLSKKENIELFETRNTTRMLELVLKGLTHNYPR